MNAIPKGIKQYLPSSIELEQIIENNPPDFSYKLDFLVHLLHLTIEIPAKNKGLLSHDGYVPFNAQILQKRDRNYHKHIDYLLKVGILEYDGKGYQPGKKSRRYRISEKYLCSTLKTVLITDKVLVRQLNSENDVDIQAMQSYDYLYKWFDKRINIDIQAAEDYLLNELTSSMNHGYYQAYASMYSKIWKLRALKDLRFWFKVDLKGRRLHTNFTNLNKELKQFITFDGKPLVSIDVKNSQPYLSVKLLEKIYSNQSISVLNTPTHYNMLVENKGSQGFTDVSHYIELVKEGIFYEFLVTNLRKHFGEGYLLPTWRYIFDKKRIEWDTASPRDLAKRIFYEIAFSKTSSKKSKEKSLFRMLFPNVLHVFELIKAKKHSELACSLQRIEASLILDKVCSEIALYHPEIPLFNIHDSIVTTKGNEAIVKSAILNHFEKEIGFPPKIQQEEWSFNVKIAA